MIKRTILMLALMLSLSIFLYPVNLEYNKEKEIKVAKEKIASDYLFAGHELEFSGESSNLYFIGNTLNFTGNIKSSILAMGKKLLINGNSQNNIHIMGNEIEINGTTNGSTFVFGNEITFNKNAVSNGAVFVYGKIVKLQGKIKGDLYSGCAELIIDGEITGNVKTTSGKIKLTDRAKINGNLDYKSGYELSDNEKSKISGVTKYSKTDRFSKRDKFRNHKDFNIFITVFRLISIITLLIGGLLLLLLPAMKSLEINKGKKKALVYALWGLIPFLIYPAAIVLFICMGITIPLAFMLFTAGLLVLFITQIIGVTIFGGFLFNIFKWKSSSRFLFFLLGLLCFALLKFIPFIWFLSIIFFSSLGWGIILEKLFNKKLVD